MRHLGRWTTLGRLASSVDGKLLSAFVDSESMTDKKLKQNMWLSFGGVLKTTSEYSTIVQPRFHGYAVQNWLDFIRLLHACQSVLNTRVRGK